MTNAIYVGDRFRERRSEATVSVFDHGLLYGDGVFEGIRAYNGRVFKLERHIERLFDSAKAIRLADPAAAGRGLRRSSSRPAAGNGIVDGYIRLVVTRGPGDLGIDPRSCPRRAADRHRPATLTMYAAALAGITMVTSSFRRPPPDTISPAIKSLNYVNNILARIEANDRGADEALMLDGKGYVAEATVDNFFIVTDGAADAADGDQPEGHHARDGAGDWRAADRHPAAEERPFTLFDVWTAKEVFICGTGAEVVPVLTVDGRPIGDGESDRSRRGSSPATRRWCGPPARRFRRDGRREFRSMPRSSAAARHAPSAGGTGGRVARRAWDGVRSFLPYSGRVDRISEVI